MTDLEVYEAPGQLGQYQAALVMTPDDAKALDDQLRACTRAVLREGTDYGVIPGTSGDQVLLKPGAEKLLQWFGFAYTMHCLDTERDADGTRQGVTYRCTVVKRFSDGPAAEVATCEGYAGYDESKFYKPAEQAQREAEAKERHWAAKDRRVANPEKWKHVGEHRAPWNTVIKMAQKRALVGATLDATAAAGLFAQDDEDDRTPAPQDDGPSWYEQAIEAALTFGDQEAGRVLFVEAAHAARDGLCTPRQANHVQNRIRQRAERLKTATVTEVEDLAANSSPAAAASPQQPPAPGATEQAAAGEDTIEMPENEPGSAGKDQLTKLHTLFTKLGFGSDDREQKLAIAEAITGRKPLTGPHEGRSSRNLSWSEAAKLTLALAVMDSRDDLIAWMSEHQQEASYEWDN